MTDNATTDDRSPLTATTTVMTARRFELSEGSSDKFWEIEQDGSDVTTRWGRRGTSGQSKTKSYASVAAATADLRKQIEAKTSKGYREVVDNDDDADDAPLVKRVPAPADDDEPETDDAADAPAALNDLDDGESTTVAGSGSNTYTLNNTAGVYSCSCPAWRHQSIPIEQRTCKHLRKFRGDAAEEHRVGTLPSRAIKPRKAKASSAGSGDNTDGDDDASAGGLDLLLAHKWDQRDPTGWWLSEKLDGVRAWWDGKRFISRLGNEFMAPDWFVADLPDHALDGELFAGRAQFQRTVSIARRGDRSEHWRELTYVVFDAPDHDAPFEERIRFLEVAHAKGAWPHARVLEHVVCEGIDHLQQELARVEALGGEGVMLRRAGSRYERGRSDSLLKVKTFHDSEARVTGHQPGAGKHKGRLGALEVELPDGTAFRVGTGFSDAEREDPPAIGSVITFRYQELTADGVPRFPSYVGVRDDISWEQVTQPSRDPVPAPASTTPPAAVSLQCVVLRCADVEASREWYAALGLQLAKEQHGKGPVHWSATLPGGVVLELYPASTQHPADAHTRLGFDLGGRRIDGLDAGADGVVKDPDGREVQLTGIHADATAVIATKPPAKKPATKKKAATKKTKTKKPKAR